MEGAPVARYDAFVLRVWRSGTGDEGQWAVRVEHLPDGMTLRFGSLATLLAYLGAELAIESSKDRGTPIVEPPVDAGKGGTG